MAISKVIEVSFGRSSVALVRIDTAYFYNNGIIFKPTDIDLPASYQVHWADSPQSTSTLETIGTAEGAPIPDDLWNRSRVIYGWIYLHPTEDSGVTAYEVRIYKNVRAGLPDGTEPTPAEQSTIDQLIGALNSAVEQTEDAEERIENMSVSATTLAEGASATVTKSEQDGVVHLAFGIPKGATGDDGYSPTANVSKTGKVATITITDKNGTTSAQVEDGTDGIDGISPSVSVTDITGGHRVVITDKDGEKSFDVEDGATGATPNLTIGTVETLDPTDDATATITGTAENPVLNFGIPKGDTGEVTTEEFLKAFPTDTASGSIASFSDGADDLPLKSLVVDINPVQDLHGQDSPYPAGGGKNKLQTTAETITSAGVTWTVNDDGSITASGTATGYSTLYIAETPVTSSMGIVTISLYGISVQSNIAINVIALLDSSKAIIHTVTGGGYSESYTVDLSNYPDVAYIKVGIKRAQNNTVTSGTIYPQIELGSTPTSWSPYENICPISGWTEVDVEQSGVNVWDEEWESGTIDTTGAKKASVERIRSKNYIPVAPNSTYYISISNYAISTYACMRYAYDINKNPIGVIGSNYSTTFTTPENCYFVMISPNAQYGTTYNHDISINYPSSDHSYHPYTGRSITINLGQTVYGGKLDVLSGVLTVDRAMVDLGTLSWAYSAQRLWFYNYSLAIKSYTVNAISSMYARKSTTDVTDDLTLDNVFTVNNTSVCIRNLAYTDITAFKSAMSGVQLCYELAEPITIQLTPNQLNSLYGVNNIWADTGDTEVVYRADTKLFIERLTAPDSEDMVADTNITSGQYFMVGNSLYKATANIANGSAIIVGTNCIRKSLSEALNEINV